MFLNISRSLGRLAILAACLLFASASLSLAGAPVFTAHSIAQLPHDPAAFTQGLLYADGVFYESTGLYGRSSRRRLDAKSGKVLASRELPGTLFGEGLALADGRLYQLTWREGRVLVADSATLKTRSVLPLHTEGWGATVLDGALVVSDGSDRIAFYDPKDMKLLGSLAVTDEGAPVTALNELEVVGGMLWANVWHDTRIAVIDPASGRVVAWVDCAALARPQLAVDAENVLNGIACDPATGRVWVTGKNWSLIHQIDVPGLPMGAPLP